MERSALVYVRFNGPERRRGAVPTSIALALLLAGCAGSSQSKLALRQPSLRVADAALAAGAPEVALRVADLTLTREPHNTRALIAKGDALYAMGERDMARAMYRTAVATDPASVAAQLGLGRTLIPSDLAAAEAAFLAATAREPNNVAALSNLGVARDLQGHHAEAQDAYRQALLVAPETTDVKVNLGLSLALSGGRDAALRVLRDVAMQSGATQDRRKELAAALVVAGDEAEARRVLSGGPTLPEMKNSPPATDLAAGVPPPAAVPHQALATGNPADPARGVGPTLIAANRRPLDEAPFVTTSLAAQAPTHPLPDMLSVSPTILTAPVVAVARESQLTSPNIDHPPPLVTTDVPSAHSNADAVVQPGTGRKSPVDGSPGPVETPAGSGTPAASAGTGAPDMLALLAKPPAQEQSLMPERTAFVQLASLYSAEDAAYEWRRLSRRMPDVLSGREPTVTPAVAHGQTYWCLRTFGFPSLADAQAMCLRMLGASGLRCWARPAS
jgi:Flp pilus assembly protein TadD